MPSTSAPPADADGQRPSAPASDTAVGAGIDLALQQLLGLQHHTITLLNGPATMPGASQAPPGPQAHIDYLTHRLGAAQVELAGARAMPPA